MTMKSAEPIKLGVIGMSQGNGHPYSWSAIINGDYNEQAMAKCGYEGICLYLAANRATLGIDDAKVTHVWTQDRKMSELVSKASLVDNVVENMADMIGQVDAVLLARDDPENHVEMAKPFIEASVPLFIDKPLASDRQGLAYFEEQIAQGKFIMSCSSMRYAPESFAVKQNIAELGELELVTSVGKKDWIKYGVHMLEGIFALLDDPKAKTVKHVSRTGKDIVHIEFANGLMAVLHLFYDISPTFQISLFGRKNWKLIEYNCWYQCFRDNLVEFVRSVRRGEVRLDFRKTHNIINTLIGAVESMQQGGKTITLT